jgi:glycosyltransferase involved in cell wall biosynthesis
MITGLGPHNHENRPLLSIVVPARDEERYLPRLLKSLKASVAYAQNQLNDNFLYEVVVRVPPA